MAATDTETLDLDSSVNVMSISVRLWNVLDRNGIKTLREVTQLRQQDLLQLKNCGIVTVRELKQELAQLGLSLKE